MSLASTNIQRQMALSGTQTGTIIREPATALFCINSEDRYNGSIETSNSVAAGTFTRTSPYDFRIERVGNLFAGEFTRIAVSEVQFAWSIPTITPANNYIGLQWSNAATSNTFKVGIPGGWYTPTTMATALQLAIRAIVSAASNFTVTADSNSGALTFYSGSTSITFWLFPLPGAIPTPNAGPSLYNQLNIVNNRTIQSAFVDPITEITYTSSNATYTVQDTDYIIVNEEVVIAGCAPSGYNGTFVVTAVTANTFTCSNATNAAVTALGQVTIQTTLGNNVQFSGVPSMIRTPFVDFECEQLTAQQGLHDGSTAPVVRDILCRLYLTSGSSQTQLVGSAPFTIQRTFPFPKQCTWKGQTNIGSLKFRVVDAWGNVLTAGLVGGNTSLDTAQQDWQMSLLFSEN